MAIYNDRVCKACEITFEGGPRAWYCPSCRAERQRKQTLESKARARAGKNRPIGSIAICVACNRAYVVTGSAQRYCPACAPEAIARKDRMQGLKYYHNNKEIINPARNERRRKETEECKECGEKFDPQGTARRYCSEECLRKRRNREWNMKYGSGIMRRIDGEA